MRMQWLRGSSKSSESMNSDAFETTLDKLTNAGSEEMKVLLKSVYHETHVIKTKANGEFTKLVGKVTDIKGNGMYYEVRGKNKETCETQMKALVAGAPVLVTKLKVQLQNKYYAALQISAKRGCGRRSIRWQLRTRTACA